MEESKIYIKNWFLENNPFFEPNIEDIYLEVEDILKGLSPQACRIELSSFLALNYSNKYLEKVEMELYEEYGDIVKEWNKLGIFTSELGCILKNLEMDISRYPDKDLDDVIKACVQKHILRDEIEMDPLIQFMQSLREDCKVSDEEQAKFKEVERIYKEKGLAKNKRMCPKCQEVITSTHRHHFARCGCGYMGIDGGLDYTEIHIFF
ncbi:DUF7695 domain-containing protein [Myroides odoratimimus]|uniref:DUF7695 domain-containing protein n=1 Tax=Myroides odoratimimus TaxID=76832 RepID=UPI002575AF91|nr:hypothetical protein [Myroides odoratimimus]MDM1499635.1 hypothetical protein [Myroides odoratimimus]